MIIVKSRLRQIIQEELLYALDEAAARPRSGRRVDPKKLDVTGGALKVATIEKLEKLIDDLHDLEKNIRWLGKGAKSEWEDFETGGYTSLAYDIRPAWIVLEDYVKVLKGWNTYQRSNVSRDPKKGHSKRWHYYAGDQAGKALPSYHPGHEAEINENGTLTELLPYKLTRFMPGGKKRYAQLVKNLPMFDEARKNLVDIIARLREYDPRAHELRSRLDQKFIVWIQNKLHLESLPEHPGIVGDMLASGPLKKLDKIIKHLEGLSKT